MSRLIVSTGWCAFEDCRANAAHTSKRCYDKFYLDKIWKHAIMRYVKPCRFFVYSSNCEVSPVLDSDDFDAVKNVDPVVEQIHSHDVFSALLVSAQYALVNNCDLLYIEQDCLVYGLDKVLDFAKNYKICFGGGQFSFMSGWAEESLFWIRKDYLSEFIGRFNRIRVFEKNEICEPITMRTFRDDVTFWPFGYGRKRPIGWDQPCFYAQQISDPELNSFKRILEIE